MNRLITRSPIIRGANTSAKTIPFVITLCMPLSITQKEIAKGLLNMLQLKYFRQTIVLLKSMALATKKPQRIIIITDAEIIFKNIENVIRTWPPAYTKKLNIENRAFNIQSPCLDKRFFVPCSTVRLYLHEILPHEEKVVYVDTDFIFIEPPENIFDNFRHFRFNHLMGAAPNRGFYETKDMREPDYFYYGETGMCTGILLMNLRGIRSFEYNWVETLSNICLAYRGRLTLYDQGILNILFSEFPDTLFDLDCRWNYNAYYCHNESSCPQVEELGSIFAVHGLSRMFFQQKVKKIKMLYQAFDEFNLGDGVEALIDLFRWKVDAIEQIQPEDTDGCKNVRGLTNALTEGLNNILERS